MADTRGAQVLRIEDLSVRYEPKLGAPFDAVKHASLTIRQGEFVGLVGESGSGKTTLGRALLRLVSSEGRIVVFGHDIASRSPSQMRPLRRDLQIVFQDPYGSLSPRLTIAAIVAEGLAVHMPDLTDRERQVRVERALAEVGLDPALADRYPHEFSGGQRQRIAIARALVLEPKLLVLDEPTSSLDVSVQAQVIDLLRELQRRHNLTYLFISHDLRVIRALANEVLVMKDGKIVERGPADAIFEAPQTDYTRTLLAAALHSSRPRVLDFTETLEAPP